MKNSNTLSYPFKVWLFTIIGAPLLLFIVTNKGGINTFNEFPGSNSIILPFIVIGCIVSLPALFAYYKTYKVIRRLRIHYVFQKLLLSSIGVFLIAATFHVTIGFDVYVFEPTLYFLPNYYYTSVLLFTFGFTLNSNEASNFEKSE